MRLNHLNGDGHLRPDQRAAYLLLNLIDNQRPLRGIDPRIVLVDFQLKETTLVRELPGTPSPSRAFSDLFWMRLPWAEIKQEVGRLNVLDLGCGSGAYAGKLASWSGGRVERYTGVDLLDRAEWSQVSAAYPFATFKTADVEQIAAQVPAETNVIVSQSMLEHVRDDRAAVAALCSYADRVSHPVVHIHLVPSAACLRLFLWHGYRQYTPRTLAALSDCCADSDRAIVGLGGSACNALHWKFITRPLLVNHVDLRDTKTAEYRHELEAAIEADVRRPQRSPAFYALVVHSRPRTHLFHKRWW